MRSSAGVTGGARRGRTAMAEPVRAPRELSHPPPGALSRLACLPAVLLIRLYRVTLSPIVGGQCRFEPTCSRYALEAYRTHGLIRGTRLTVARLLRCHPLCKGGYDPVPLNRWGEECRQEGRRE